MVDMSLYAFAIAMSHAHNTALRIGNNIYKPYNNKKKPPRYGYGGRYDSFDRG